MKGIFKMDIFDEIYAAAKDGFKKTEQAAEKLVDKGRINLEILRLERKLKKAYETLGMRVYNNSAADVKEDKFILMKINEIDLIKEKIEKLKLDNEYVEYCEKCKNCGSYNAKEDTVCRNCGADVTPFNKAVYSVEFDSDNE